MTKQRARELKSIAVGIYADVLDIMGSHKRGHIKGEQRKQSFWQNLPKQLCVM